MIFNLFRKKAAKDPYLEKVASILHSTLRPMMPIQNAYDLAAECLGELKSNISKGMFRDGANPREAVMAYYSLCCRRQSNTGHLCQLNSDQGLKLAA
jgi:hypothetical protein